MFLFTHLCLLWVVYAHSTFSQSIDVVNNIVEENDEQYFNYFPFPVENTEPSRSRGRTAEWHKDYKTLTPIANDTSITPLRYVSVSESLVKNYYTISALLSGPTSNSIYILRRRQDPPNGVSEITETGYYERVTEGAIAVNCILLINISTGTAISGFGNNTFYFPNAMVKDPTGNFWFSDAGQHRVLQLNPGRTTPTVSIGEQFTPGKGMSRLCAPTDVAVTSRHVYISDGHCNGRIVLFNKYGRYLREFSTSEKTNPLSSSLSYIEQPRALAVDELRNRLYLVDCGKNKVVTVMAGEGNQSSFGKYIRYFRHNETWPCVQRIALHPVMPYMFVFNTYNNLKLHRGFTFHTHDTSFKGAWGPDPRGFVRPRAITISPDGSRVYVADATEETPERIWIFSATEYLRSRRHARPVAQQNYKGQLGQLLSGGKGNKVHSSFYNRASAFHSPTKGVNRRLTNGKSLLYQSVYFRLLANHGAR